MAHQLDPEGREVAAVNAVVELGGRRVLEIGCGDGRLMMRCAARSSYFVGIDPAHENCRNVRLETPRKLHGIVEIVRGDAEHLPFRNASFDVAIFGWSL